MKSCYRTLGVCLFTIVVCCVADSAQAQGYYGGGSYGGGYGRGNFGYGINRSYVHGNHAAPPYFALNPPVYYGNVRPRDYGSSPFPYGPYGGDSSAASSRSTSRQWAMSPVRGERMQNPYMYMEENVQIEMAPSSPVDVQPVDVQPVDVQPVEPEPAVPEKIQGEPVKDLQVQANGRIRNPYVTDEDQSPRVAQAK